jgi:hypothetical protein
LFPWSVLLQLLAKADVQGANDERRDNNSDEDKVAHSVLPHVLAEECVNAVHHENANDAYDDEFAHKTMPTMSELPPQR